VEFFGHDDPSLSVLSAPWPDKWLGLTRACPGICLGKAIAAGWFLQYEPVLWQLDLVGFRILVEQCAFDDPCPRLPEPAGDSLFAARAKSHDRTSFWLGPFSEQSAVTLRVQHNSCQIGRDKNCAL